MQLFPLKSKRLNPRDSLLKALQDALKKAGKKLQNGDVLVIASKAFAYAENRFAPFKTTAEFRALVRKEADRVFDESDMMITLKNNILIPNAGIDKSNTPKNIAVLWPRNPFASVQGLRTALLKTYRLKKIGIVMSDSHCQPLRWGTTGLALAWAGFEGVEDVRGQKDLFGKSMQYTRIAVADDLASAANILMGETNASIPFVLIKKAPVHFTGRILKMSDYQIPLKQDIYRACYNAKLLR